MQHPDAFSCGLSYLYLKPFVSNNMTQNNDMSFENEDNKIGFILITIEGHRNLIEFHNTRVVLV